MINLLFCQDQKKVGGRVYNSDFRGMGIELVRLFTLRRKLKGLSVSGMNPDRGAEKLGVRSALCVRPRCRGGHSRNVISHCSEFASPLSNSLTICSKHSWSFVSSKGFHCFTPLSIFFLLLLLLIIIIFFLLHRGLFLQRGLLLLVLLCSITSFGRIILTRYTTIGDRGSTAASL